MTDMTCVRCQTPVAPQLIDFMDDGAVCRTCLVTAASDPVAIANGERELMRSMGWRQLIAGIIMLVVGISVLALGLSGGGSLVLIPTGFLLGGAYEVFVGLGKLTGAVRP